MRCVCQGRLGPSSPSMPLSLFPGERRFNLSARRVQTSDGLSRRGGHRLSPHVRLLYSILIEESPQIRRWFILELPWQIFRGFDVKVKLS